MARRTCDCGECQKCKHREYMNAWYRRPDRAQRVRAWAKRYREQNEEVVREYDRKRKRTRDPVKARANGTVLRALTQGRIERPDVCECCRQLPGRGSDGRTLLQAHHPDYSKPLEVQWLCAGCHGAAHRKIA